jgi:RsiW-degrading membrane proteinase PrsW (M82 family)
MDRLGTSFDAYIADRYSTRTNPTRMTVMGPDPAPWFARKEVIMTIAAILLFIAALGYAIWKALKSRPQRVYWCVCTAMLGCALLGMSIVAIEPATVDEKGFVHEQFALMALSMMLAAAGLLATAAGILWNWLRGISARWRTRPVQ